MKRERKLRKLLRRRKNSREKKETPTLEERDGLSTLIKQTQDAEYYKRQCDLYFDTMDSSVPKMVEYPKYSNDIVRWEWPPGLRVTGTGKEAMIAVDTLRKFLGAPLHITERKYEVFECQPFVRATAKFGCDGKSSYKMYHEFSFNIKGEIMFIEVWYSRPAKSEEQGSNRLSTQIPGLGRASSKINMTRLREMSEPEKAPKWAQHIPATGHDTLVDKLIDKKEEPKVTENKKWIQRFTMDVGVPAGVWFRATLRTVFRQQDPSELLNTLKEKRTEIETTSCDQHVCITFPESNDDDAWKIEDPVSREAVLKIIFKAVPDSVWSKSKAKKQHR